MTRRTEPDPMASYGKRLHELLTEALDLAQRQEEVETPDPGAWVRLAQEAYTFHSGLSAGDAAMAELRSFARELEHTFLARSRLEAQPPQRVLFFGQTLIEARRAFDGEMTRRLIPLAEALAKGQRG